MSSGFRMINIELTLQAGLKIKIKLTWKLREINLPYRPLNSSAIRSEIGRVLGLFTRVIIGRTAEITTENSINDHKMKFSFRFFL